jgi:uncharacterized membrane protein YgaE (UPF0421/DUF939 family)
MNLLQKATLVVVAAALTMSGLALIQGEFSDAAVGVFVSACALFTNFRMWPPKPQWRRRKD